ncbi:MAG: lysylphosphatidylglycerol synthase transmembrane domain-containing protein, partial [Kiritimatiellia bacterium]
MSEGKHHGRMLLTIKLAVSLLFVWFVLRKINLVEVMEHLRGADTMQLFYAVATLTAGGFAGAAAWFAVLKSSHYTLSYQRVAVMYWCGMFFNSFLPSNIGGDFYKGYLLVKGSGGGLTKAAITMLLDRLINLSVLVVIGILSLCLTFSYYLLTAVVAAMYLGALLLLIFMAHRQIG